MAEQIYTIPVNDAFDSGCECPMCQMQKDLERNAIEYTMGPSYMEDDNRAMTDKLGFCSHHLRMLYQEKNRLGLALMMNTHMNKTIQDMRALAAKGPAAKAGLFGKNTPNAPVVDYIENMEKSCFICGRMDDMFVRYVDTIFHMWKRDSEFRDKFATSKGFCTYHYGILYKTGQNKLSKEQYAQFIEILNKVYSGIVAIPHLSRDLLACYDGNGSNFGTHPQNVLRGMIYDSKTWEYPYLYNLIDQYRHLAKFNNGYSYNMMFVGPGWLNKMGRWEAPYELLKKSYEDGMKYYGDLKKEGKCIDMTMAEFADFYRENKTYEEPECALWKDILYGSDKQIFWYCDPYMRAQINMDQGGAIVDLRPYAAKLNWPVGIGTPHVQDASYPFLIQEKYRAGYFTHYAGEGTVRSAKISYKGEEVDLCLCRTKATFSQEGSTRILTLDPVDIEFYDLTVKLQTKIYFEEGSSKIRHERTILEMSNPDAEVEINEYMVACYGTTEYPEDMTGITLTAKNASESKSLTYEYKCREEDLAGADEVSAVIPAIETKAAMGASGSDATGYFKEGYAFSPMFTLGYTKTLKDKEVFSTWLSLEKAN